MNVRRCNARRPRRGFAMLLALALLALAGAAAVAVGLAVTRDFQRTRRQADEAQLRQLLLAGGSAVTSRLQAGQDVPGGWTIAVPKELAERGAVLRATPVNGKPDELTLTVHAELANRSREQQLRFTRADGRWRLVSATTRS